MAQHGIEVHAACAPGPRADAFERETRVPVHAIRMQRSVLPRSDASSVAEMITLIRRVRPAIVHAHTPKGGLVGMLAAAAAGVSGRIYHMRGLPYLTARGAMRGTLWTTESVSCGLAKRVLAVSPSLATAARDARFIGREKITVLAKGSSNGVDAKRFSPEAADGARLRSRLGLDEGQPVVTFVGRIVQDKGIAELVEAWSLVRRAHPAARLLLVGPREERDPIPPGVWESICSDATMLHIDFTEDMPEVYAASDIVVLPTHREGFPNVPLEAAAMERPVVTTDAVGAVDAVDDGVTGFIVPVGDGGALAHRILQYLAAPGLARTHGRAGRERAIRDFAPAGIWRELLGLYQEMA